LLASSLSLSRKAGFPTECFLSRKMDISFFPGAGSDGLRVPVAGLTRVDSKRRTYSITADF